MMTIKFSNGAFFQWENNFLNADVAIALLQGLVTKVPWRSEDTMSLASAWYGKQFIPWNPLFLRVKALVEAKVPPTQFNCMSLYHYRDGNDNLRTDHDSDKSAMRRSDILALVAVGGIRRLIFVHRITKESSTYEVEPGSLWILGKNFLNYFRYGILKEKNVNPSIHLMFRSKKSRLKIEPTR